MAIVLFRVDERLIHGQVVVGWGNHLHPDVIVVVDDDLAGSPWEQELYVLGVPSEMQARFETVADARGLLQSWRSAPARFVVLTRDIETMGRLAGHGAMRGEEVNIGGIHHAPGRAAILPYVYLSEEERAQVAALRGEGVVVSARDLPDARRVGLDQLLSDEPPAP